MESRARVCATERCVNVNNSTRRGQTRTKFNQKREVSLFPFLFFPIVLPFLLVPRFVFLRLHDIPRYGKDERHPHRDGEPRRPVKGGAVPGGCDEPGTVNSLLSQREDRVLDVPDVLHHRYPEVVPLPAESGEPEVDDGFPGKREEHQHRDCTGEEAGRCAFCEERLAAGQEREHR